MTSKLDEGGDGGTWPSDTSEAPEVTGSPGPGWNLTRDVAG